MPRWGEIGKQRIEDEGPLAPFPDMSNVQNMHDITPKAKYDMTTFDDVLVEGVQRLHGQGQGGRQAVLRLAQHHAHARLDVPVAEVPGDDEQQDQLRPRRGRHGADGRQRRRAAQAPRRHRRGRQHHRHLHDRQRRRGLHLAGRRHDPVQGHQGHRLRRRVPRSGDHPLAGPRQARNRRERHHFRPRLVPDADDRRRKSEHHRPAAEGRRSRRHAPTRTIWTATTRPRCSPATGPSARHELFYFGGAQLGRDPDRRHEVHLLPAAGRDGRGRRSRRTCRCSSTSVRTRSSAPR